MSEFALKSISVIIGAFFTFFGVLKVVPLFSADLFHEMRGIFDRSASVFPFQSLTGWKPNPNEVRRIYGATEIVAGIMLMLGRGITCDIASGALLTLVLFTLYGNWALGEGLREASHGIVLGLVLTCRFVIRLQTMQKVDEAVEGALYGDGIDVAFRAELRRRIHELHQSVCEAREVIAEKESGAAVKKSKRSKKGDATKTLKAD